MSSSVTASLTESCFKVVVDSAMMTGVKLVDIRFALLFGRGDDIARGIDRGPAVASRSGR